MILLASCFVVGCRHTTHTRQDSGRMIGQARDRADGARSVALAVVPRWTRARSHHNHVPKSSKARCPGSRFEAADRHDNMPGILSACDSHRVQPSKVFVSCHLMPEAPVWVIPGLLRSPNAPALEAASEGLVTRVRPGRFASPLDTPVIPTNPQSHATKTAGAIHDPSPTRRERETRQSHGFKISRLNHPCLRPRCFFSTA